MSDEPKNPSSPKPELSTETRLLLAFALMGLVLFATPYFFKSVAPPPAVKKAQAAQQQKTAAAMPATPAETSPAEEQPQRGFSLRASRECAGREPSWSRPK